jgi:hypothetical protein
MFASESLGYDIIHHDLQGQYAQHKEIHAFPILKPRRSVFAHGFKEIRFAKSLYAPETPSGNWRKKAMPV